MKRFSFLFYTLLFITTAFSQVDIFVQITPPYTHKWQDYLGNTGKLIITARNTSQQDVPFYLAGSIRRISGGTPVSITVPPPPLGGQANPSIALVAYASTVTPFNTTQIANFFDRRGSGQLEGIENRSLINGLIPEGTYELCLQAYGLDGMALGNSMTGCVTFPIYLANPPRLIAPVCGTAVTQLNPQVMNFTWTMPQGSQTAGVLWNYELKVVEVPQGMEANTAMNNSTIFKINEIVYNNNYIVTAGNLPFESGKTYAWRVKAIDPLNTTGIQNLGFSEVCTFTYSGDGNLRAEAVWPLNNDWIPFRQIPFFAKFTPYSDIYTNFTSITTITYNGSRLQESRNLNWPQGPRVTQQTLLHESLTNDQACQIVVYPENQPGLGVSSPLIRGKKVDWESNISLGIRGNNSINYQSLGFNASFNIGMSKSVCQVPSNGAKVTAGNIRFEWLTANAPSRIRPSYLPIQARAGSMNFVDANIEEAWMLEISRQSNFQTILHSERGEIGRGLSLNSTETELRNGLYRTINFSKVLQDTGKYYWRVKWLKNPQSTSDTSAYQYSSPFNFRILKDSSRVQAEAVPPVRSACVASCDAEPLTNREETATASIGTIIKMGKFDLTVTEITWSGGSAFGKGTVQVPFMRTSLIVSFSGLKLNRNNQALAGTATADYDPQSPITSSEQTRTFSQLTGMSESQINGIHGFYTQASRLVSQLTSTNPTKLPIGLDNDYQGTKYVIGIVGVYFTHQRATLNVLFKVDFPEADGWLSLGATDICFHPSGMAGTGRGMLYNPLNKTIRMGETNLIFKRTVFATNDYNSISDSGTYAMWDCDGFKILQIKGEIHFGRDVVVPDNADGTTGSGIVKGYFNTKVRNLRQFILDFRMDRFQSPGAPGWGFEILNASFDFSDRDNPPGFRLPANYQDAPPQIKLWKGFYLKTFKVFMPPAFRPNGGTEPRTSFAAENMFIDRTGLSLEFNIKNRIVSENECTVDGWAFGIDSIKLKILQLGHSRGEFAGNMAGKFKLPISPTSLGYTCNISASARRVAFGIAAGSIDTLNVPLWFASMQLNRTLIGFRYSSTEVSTPTGAASWESSFALTAELSGSLSINGRPRSQSFNPGEVRIPDLRFQNLKLTSDQPYFECPDQSGRGCVYFAMNSPQRSVGGFPITLNSVGIVARPAGSDGSGIHPMEWDRTAGPRIGLRIGFSIITGGNSAANSGSSSTNSNGFVCTSSISFVGRLNSGGGAQWVPTGLLVDSIMVSGTTAAVTMLGSAIFFTSDAIYGDGFKGEFRADIRPGINIRVAAQFGNKQEIRYWYADGMMSLPTGIPIGPTGLNIYGFGGGVYSNMRIEGSTSPSSLTGNANQVNRSSVRYVPVNNNTVGIKATIALGAAKKEVLYGEGTLEVAISPTEGLQSIGMSGNCRFMSAPGNTNSTSVSGDFNFIYRSPVTTFDGTVNVFVNAAAGVIKGAGENNRAGTLTLHFSPQTWHIKLGVPENRIGLKFTIPGLPGAGINANAYLMAGRQLPGIPEPGTLVKSIVTPPSGGWGANRESLADGFCLGAAVSFNTGSQTVANFIRYRLQAELGFDVAIRDLANVSCMAANGSYTPGINGWYANGQAYAAISGGLALKIPLPVSEEFVSVADFSAALLLNAGLPNPWWLKGEVAGSLNLLGFIRIDRFSFPFQVGERCMAVTESPMASQPLIVDLKPGSNEREVDPFTYPEVALNFAHNSSFSLEMIDAEGNKKAETYKIFLQELKVVEVSNGSRMAGASWALPIIESQQRSFGVSLGKTLTSGYSQGGVLEIMNGGYSVRLKTESMLKPNTLVRLTATAFAMKYVSGSGWEMSKRKNNSPIYQDSAHNFNIGPIPIRMRDEYVKFTYPYRGQRYMLPQECGSGRVEIWTTSMMNAYFSNDPRPGYTTQYTARFIALDGSSTQDVAITKYTPSGYSPSIQFNFPPLANNKKYALILVRKVSRPNSQNGGLTLSSTSMTSQYINSGAITRRTLGPLAMGAGETAVYTLFFKTSNYNRLQEKLNANSISNLNRTALGVMESFSMQIGGAEGFDEFDAYPYVSNGLNQGESSVYPSLIEMEAEFSANWYARFANPNIYQLASDIERMGGGRVNFNRGTTNYGIPPKKTVKFSDYEGYIYGKLSASECRPANPSNPNLNLVDFNDATLLRFASVLSSQVNRSFVTGSGSSQAVISYTTPTVVAFDWAALRTKCQSLTQIYGQPETSEFFPYPMKPKIRKVLNNQYELFDHGTYRIQFKYVIPGQPCGNADTQNYNFKSFTY